MTTLTFSSGWDIVMGLGKPKLHTKFEVAIYSRCKNIKGEPQILGSSLSPGPLPFFYGQDIVMGLGKDHLPANLEVAIFSRCGNIKGEPQILGRSSRHAHFLLWV